MNREIKFRAWDKENHRMEDDFSIHADGRIGLFDSASSLADILYPNFIPMQFTGLKDKNGKEIYEGDVLRAKSFTFKVRELEHYLHHPKNYLSARFCKDAEIIGNVWENPDLLSPN